MTRCTILLVKDDHADRWVAHCLDFDLTGAGEDRTEALVDLTDLMDRIAVMDALEEREPFAGCQPAPADCWELAVQGRPEADR